MSEHPSAGAGPTGRLAWLEPIAAQIATETGVPNGEEVEDLVVLAFEGLLNDPAAGGMVTYCALLERAQRGARRWATERGTMRLWSSTRSSDPDIKNSSHIERPSSC